MVKDTHLTILIRIVLVVLCTAGTFFASASDLIVGAERSDLYLPLLEGKRIGLLSNHTGVLSDGTHTLDRLHSLGLDVRVIFSPEHGFRGTADAGRKVNSSVDTATGLPIVSLYGKDSKSKAEAALEEIDVIVTDLQDVGTRFYTYYITMMEMMKRAADTGKQFVVFDRPNPNGMYVDGPILQRSLYSGVGRIPAPVVHGMTLGELARMIVGEKWIDTQYTLDLSIVPCKGYRHSMSVSLPVSPSPNLRSERAIALYPSICFFEGTPVSLGRGTDDPFTLYGHPAFAGKMRYSFVPRPQTGAANPPLNGLKCYGESLSDLDIDSIHARGLDLTYIIRAYNIYKTTPAAQTKPFFTKFFDNLIGDPAVKEMIKSGKSAAEIKASWADDINRFIVKRRPYLLYPE